MKPDVHACESALAILPEKVLVAVSGGLDSIALLHALATIGRQPVVLHFDHGWRAESATDAAFVRDRARACGLRFLTAKMAKPKRTAREADARAARYAFFARTAQRLGIRDLVLAHHADDQVETFLLQLLRGAGAGGHGMETVARREGLVLHRPWLGIWRKEICAYARTRKLAWREDASNADTRHRRNLIRTRLVPYLRKLAGPASIANLWRAAEIARSEGEWLDALCVLPTGANDLSVKTLCAQPVAQQRRTILRWLQARGILDVSFAAVESVRGLLENRIPAKVNLSAGHHARRREGRLFVE